MHSFISLRPLFLSLFFSLLIVGPLTAGENEDSLLPPEEASAESVSPGNGEETVDAGEASEESETGYLADQFDQTLAKINGVIFTFIFYDLSFGIWQQESVDEETGEVTTTGPRLPFVIVFLAAGAFFFTFYHRAINLRGFKHAWMIVGGRYNHQEYEGDVTPFRALTSALSATVGLGNIAGVAVAMVIGGPGALFWMMVLGFFGMASKFHETILAQMFRIKNEDGSYSGGPMYSISLGFAHRYPSLASVGKGLAILFAVCLMFASLGGGNMYQANQAYEAFYTTFVEAPFDLANPEATKTVLSYGFGLLLATIVGFIVLGGITRIGATTSRLVPFMALLYVGSCLLILILHANQIPAMMALVMEKAFSMDSAYGGLIGAMIVGFQRAAFSSEAGLGSSAVVHAAAKTKEPVREGFVASLEPFIDTIVVCFMTGMVVLITGAYLEVEGGAAVTLHAFSQTPVVGNVLQYVLSVCIILFALSTMLAWCYYGERAWGYLAGIRSVVIFRLAFVVCVFIGSVASLSRVIDFADAALLSTCIPNIIGGILLAPLVRRKVIDYWKRYRAGEFEQD